MAKKIQLKQKDSGILKTGFYGFSWTTLFFGGFPALFRGDFLTFLGLFAVLFFIALATHPIAAFIAMFIWSFFYNGYYTKRLLEKGYTFSDFQEANEDAAKALGVAIPIVSESNESAQPIKPVHSAPSIFTNEEKSLSNDAYKIYLVKKYPLEFNEVLKKYIFNNKLFDSIDDALITVHQVEIANESIARSKIYYTNKREAISFLTLINVEVTESNDRKITVKEKNSTQYFFSDDEFLNYANKKAVDLHK